MPFEIVRNDIANMQVDAIVNTANPKPIVGTGVDSSIHKKAGRKLLSARRKIGCIGFGDVALTPAFNLNAKYVIHTVGPVWIDGNHHEEETLASCYQKSLTMAHRCGCESVAFPLIATGNYEFPKALALQIAVREISTFLLQHDLHVYLVVFDKEAFELSEKLFTSVSTYVDEHYVQHKELTEYNINHPRSTHHTRRTRDAWGYERHVCESARPSRQRTPQAHRRAKPTAFFDPITGKPLDAADNNVSSDISPATVDNNAVNATPPTMAVGASPAIADAMPTTYTGTLTITPFAATLGAINTADTNDWEKLLDNLDASFSETLLQLIDRTGKKDSEIYKKANVDRKLFSKIRNNPHYKPSKTTALAFAFALELNLDETKDFIGRAGFALSHSSKFDVIVEYFLVHHNYNVFELNEVLFAFDQPLLGV